MAHCQFSRGGVALLMFVDPVSFGVLQWSSCFLVKFASQFNWFYGFSVRWPSNMDVSSPERFRIVFGSFFGSGSGFFVGFLSWYHLPCICNSLELESVILHGICYILAWLLCILHGICYIWPCSRICHVLALQPLLCKVFATFWYFKRSCGFLESFFRLSFRVSFRVSFGVSFRVSVGFHLGFHLRFHLGFL